MKKIIIVLISLFLAMSVQAASNSHKQLPFYFGIGAGLGYHSPDPDWIKDFSEPATTINVYVGYTFSPNWAVQVGYTYMSSYKQNEQVVKSFDTYQLLQPYERFTNHYGSVSGLYTYHFNKKLSLTGQFGLAATTQVMEYSYLPFPDSSSTLTNSIWDRMFTPLLGTRLNYNFNQHWQVSAGVRYIMGSKARLFRSTYFVEHINDSLFYETSLTYHL